MGAGRKVGATPKYTVGIGYVMAFRRGRTPEQIAKFFKAPSINSVKTSLKNHGVDLEREQTKKVKKLASQVKKLQDKIAKLEKKPKAAKESEK